MYKGVIRRTDKMPYYAWEEKLSKWEDDEFEDEWHDRQRNEKLQEKYEAEYRKAKRCNSKI